MALFFCPSGTRVINGNIGFGVLYPEVETYSIARTIGTVGFGFFYTFQLHCRGWDDKKRCFGIDCG